MVTPTISYVNFFSKSRGILDNEGKIVVIIIITIIITIQKFTTST